MKDESSKRIWIHPSSFILHPFEEPLLPLREVRRLEAADDVEFASRFRFLALPQQEVDQRLPSRHVEGIDLQQLRAVRFRLVQPVPCGSADPTRLS